MAVHRKGRNSVVGMVTLQRSDRSLSPWVNAVRGEADHSHLVPCWRMTGAVFLLLGITSWLGSTLLCDVKKVKCSRYRPAVAQRVGRVIALLFDDRGTRRGWVVSSTPRLHFTSGKDPVPIVQEAGWAPGPVWTGGKSRPHRDSIPDRPALSQSLYRLSYPAHNFAMYKNIILA